MTDMVNGMSQVSDAPSSTPPVTPQPAQAVTPTQAEERNFKQSDVDQIVKRAKSEAVESYRRMQTQQPEYLAQKYGESGVSHPNQSTLNETDYRKIAAEEAQRLRDTWMQDAQRQAQDEQIQNTVKAFVDKVTPGRDKYEDFEKVVGNIQYDKFPNVVQLLAHHLDNSADVLYELGKNRMKMTQLEIMAREFPQEAIYEAQKLAQSLKENDAARNVRSPRPPLDQMRPSNTGMSTDSALAVRDYRAKYKV